MRPTRVHSAWIVHPLHGLARLSYELVQFAMLINDLRSQLIAIAHVQVDLVLHTLSRGVEPSTCERVSTSSVDLVRHVFQPRLSALVHAARRVHVSWNVHWAALGKILIWLDEAVRSGHAAKLHTNRDVVGLLVPHTKRGEIR